jgi:glycosyltransferase involved in cell wall biosynthesis
MSAPVVSVVIPTYNRAHVIGDAVASVMAQTFRQFELVVVDDGSTDGTAEILASISDPRLRAIRQANAGAAAARNAGVRAARGTLISFLDSDDLWKPDKLEREVAFLDRHPEVDSVFADLEKYDGTLFVPSFMRATQRFVERLEQGVDPDGVALTQREMFLYLLEESPVMPTAFTIRRAAFDALGGFHTRWEPFEDWEFCLRYSRTRRFGYVDRIHAVVHVSKDSIHRLHSVRGRTSMLWLMKREGRLLGDDAEARAALRRGMLRLYLHLGWHYARSGRRASAAITFLRGFLRTADPGLLLRVLAAPLPLNTVARVRRAVTRPRAVQEPAERGSA